ncbi:MAG: hypothetical protein HKN76_00605 [Saprospiraceae bacterium]|nr:hypothetical protein [Saprospiraceae bacterium]
MKLLYLFLPIVILHLISCTTEIPFDPEPMDPEPMDSSAVAPVDSSNMDSIDSGSMNADSMSLSDSSGTALCDSSIVYFEQQILPIFVGNCALSGCHDAASAQEGIVLESYSNLAEHKDLIVPYDPDKSELFEKITEDDLSDRMPPSPRDALTQQQIYLIKKWIEQGAENTICEEKSDCDTSTVSYAQDVQPILDTYCITCHGTSNPDGGVNLSNYARVILVANSGKLLGVVSWTDGFLRMPLGGSQIPLCSIEKIGAWINQGALDN